MPRLTDPDRLAAYRDALGNWSVTGYIDFEWSDHEFHYDLRFTINGKPVYIETRLNYRPPFVRDQPTILVVNIHAR